MNPKTKLNSSLFKLILILSLLILLFLKPSFEEQLDKGKLLIYSSFALVFFIWHLIRESKRNNNNWLRIDTFFILGFFIVHFQWPIMLSISDIMPEVIGRVWGTGNHVNYGVWLALVGSLMWILGFNSINSYLQNQPNTKKRHSKTKNIILSKYNWVLNITILLFLSFLILAGRNFLNGSIYRGESDNLSGDGIAPYIYILFSLFLILITVLTVLKYKQLYNGHFWKWFLRIDKRYLILLLSYSLIFFTIGDRGGPLAIIILLFILIGTYVKPIKWWSFITIFMVGAIMMTIIGIGRADTSGQGTLMSGYNNLEINSIYSPTEQLANSIRTLFYSLEDVPSKQDYFYGKLWLSSFLSPIPFAQSTYLGISNDKDYLISSAGYITYIVYGANPMSGEGTSFIADIYLNFGALGVFIFCFFIGRLFKRLNIELIKEYDIRWILIACIVASVSFYFGRASFFIITRNVVWGLIILKIIGNRKNRLI